MRFASIGSGSRGNGTLIQSGATTLLVDCGFGIREVERRLARLQLDIADVSAIVVTHEHADHIGGVAALAQRHQIPVWLTSGTLRACSADFDAAIQVNIFSHAAAFQIGDLQIQPVVVPHDANEPAQFVFSDGARRVGVLTDVGSITPHIKRAFDQLDAFMLEFNHDADLLAGGPYPPFLKARVAGDFGHLSNAQAASLLRDVDTSRLQHLIAMHLSAQNNSPEHALQAAGEALGCTPDWLCYADQERGLDWRELT